MSTREEELFSMRGLVVDLLEQGAIAEKTDVEVIRLGDVIRLRFEDGTAYDLTIAPAKP